MQLDWTEADIVDGKLVSFQISVKPEEAQDPDSVLWGQTQCSDSAMHAEAADIIQEYFKTDPKGDAKRLLGKKITVQFRRDTEPDLVASVEVGSYLARIKEDHPLARRIIALLDNCALLRAAELGQPVTVRIKLLEVARS